MAKRPRKAEVKAEPVVEKTAPAADLQSILRAMEDEAKADRKAFYEAGGNARAVNLRFELTDAIARLNALITA